MSTASRSGQRVRRAVARGGVGRESVCMTRWSGRIVQMHSMRTMWALCGLLALSAGAAVAPATRPMVVAIDDNAFDAALMKARDQEGAELQQTLAAVSSRFQSVDVCTSAGRNMWSIRTLNERGKRIDAVRFTVPEGTHTHLYWAFSVADLDSWYIVPVQGELKGFENFYPGLKFRLPAMFNAHLILQE